MKTKKGNKRQGNLQDMGGKERKEGNKRQGKLQGVPHLGALAGRDGEDGRRGGLNHAHHVELAMKQIRTGIENAK